ncbi:MAG: DUF4188 domain-containing protein [Tetrasphaera sp.]|nr:DUF4188 domain-containing protein [Tetrasphaera sp.]
MRRTGGCHGRGQCRTGDPSVGIWHETYTITPGHDEVLYGHMPAFGLGKAATGRGDPMARAGGGTAGWGHGPEDGSA